MANWKYKIDISGLWNKYNENNNLEELKKDISLRLKDKAKEIEEKNYKKDLIQIADNFLLINDVGEFDIVMCELYDWGDTITKPSDSVIQNRLAWINILS